MTQDPTSQDLRPQDLRPTAILESALYAADLDAARAFYTEILGLELIGEQPGRHLFFRVGAGILLVFNPAETEIPAPAGRLPVPAHGTRGPGHLCFAATRDDLARWQARLEAAGVTIESVVDWPGHAGTPPRSIYIRDPAGNSLEFAEPRLWG
ncbi:VOC family protein [Xinfangfangia pollutisoli]|uniref:VOC family protein n=1 Tax=Xinfangfangia pollutisoli TaxID=2865960 RepID=UPI001CD6361D|nr:VOC family protein [Xinfangfangia pollutisoli]